MCKIVCFHPCVFVCIFFFFQAEDGIRDLVRSRGLGDVYKRQINDFESLLEGTLNNLKHMLKEKAYCIFILGEVCRSKNPIDTHSIFQEIAINRVGGFKIVDIIEDRIPHERRTRKNGKRTKLEWINVLQKEN